MLALICVFCHVFFIKAYQISVLLFMRAHSGSWIERIHIFFIYALCLCHVTPRSRSGCCTWMLEEKLGDQGLV